MEWVEVVGGGRPPELYNPLGDSVISPWGVLRRPPTPPSPRLLIDRKNRQLWKRKRKELQIQEDKKRKAEEERRKKRIISEITIVYKKRDLLGTSKLQFANDEEASNIVNKIVRKYANQSTCEVQRNEYFGENYDEHPEKVAKFTRFNPKNFSVFNHASKSKRELMSYIQAASQNVKNYRSKSKSKTVKSSEQPTSVYQSDNLNCSYEKSEKVTTQSISNPSFGFINIEGNQERNRHNSVLKTDLNIDRGRPCTQPPNGIINRNIKCNETTANKVFGHNGICKIDISEILRRRRLRGKGKDVFFVNGELVKDHHSIMTSITDESKCPGDKEKETLLDSDGKLSPTAIPKIIVHPSLNSTVDDTENCFTCLTDYDSSCENSSNIVDSPMPELKKRTIFSRIIPCLPQSRFIDEFKLEANQFSLPIKCPSNLETRYRELDREDSVDNFSSPKSLKRFKTQNTGRRKRSGHAKINFIGNPYLVPIKEEDIQLLVGETNQDKELTSGCKIYPKSHYKRHKTSIDLNESPDYISPSDYYNTSSPSSTSVESDNENLVVSNPDQTAIKIQNSCLKRKGIFPHWSTKRYTAFHRWSDYKTRKVRFLMGKGKIEVNETDGSHYLHVNDIPGKLQTSEIFILNQGFGNSTIFSTENEDKCDLESKKFESKSLDFITVIPTDKNNQTLNTLKVKKSNNDKFMKNKEKMKYFHNLTIDELLESKYDCHNNSRCDKISSNCNIDKSLCLDLHNLNPNNNRIVNAVGNNPQLTEAKINIFMKGVKIVNGKDEIQNILPNTENRPALRRSKHLDCSGILEQVPENLTEKPDTFTDVNGSGTRKTVIGKPCRKQKAIECLKNQFDPDHRITDSISTEKYNLEQNKLLNDTDQNSKFSDETPMKNSNTQGIKKKKSYDNRASLARYKKIALLKNDNVDSNAKRISFKNPSSGKRSVKKCTQVISKKDVASVNKAPSASITSGTNGASDGDGVQYHYRSDGVHNTITTIITFPASQTKVRITHFLIRVSVV